MKIYRLRWIPAIVDSPGVWRRGPAREVFYKDEIAAIYTAQDLLATASLHGIIYTDKPEIREKHNLVYKHSIAEPYCAWVSFIQTDDPITVTIKEVEVL